MYNRKIISKVPGNLPTEPKNEKQGYIGDLSKKTVPQLKDLLDRQLKLLANRPFINKLADKGEKITRLKETIEEELKKRDESEKLSQMLSALSMNGKEDLDALEWTGRCAPGHVIAEDDAVSDDETDPLRILATHSGAGFHKKKQRVIKPDEPLVKPSDVEDVEPLVKPSDVEDVEPLVKPSDVEDVEARRSVENKENNEHDDTEVEVFDEYAKHLCVKMDSVMTTSVKTKFMPYKTLNERKEGENNKGRGKENRNWEVTAATPPPAIHGDVKMVSLQESIRLQFEQHHKLKEVQMKHAAERLAVMGQSLTIGRMPQHVGDYRDPTSGTSSEDEGSEHEVHDEEEPDGGGVVIYNLVDDHENS